MDLRTVANVSGHLKKQYTKVKRKAIYHLKPGYTVHFELNGEDYWLPTLNGTKVSTNPSKSAKFINSRFTSEAKVQKYISNVKKKINPSLAIDNDSNQQDYSGLTKRRLQPRDITNTRMVTRNQLKRANTTEKENIEPMSTSELFKLKKYQLESLASKLGIEPEGRQNKVDYVTALDSYFKKLEAATPANPETKQKPANPGTKQTPAEEATQTPAEEPTPAEEMPEEATPAEPTPAAEATSVKQQKKKKVPPAPPKQLEPEEVIQAPAQPNAPEAEQAQILSRARAVLKYYESRNPNDQGVRINLTTLQRLMVNPSKFERILKIVSFLERTMPKTSGLNSLTSSLRSQEQQASSSLQNQIDEVKQETQKLESQRVDITKDSLPVKEAQTKVTAQVDKYIDEKEQITYEKDVIKAKIRSNYSTFGTLRLPGAGLLTINCQIDPESDMNDIFG